MINMFSFCFALILFVNLSVNGQNNNLNTLPRNSVGPNDFFGELHHLIDQQNQDQPASVSCYRIRPNIKNAYPSDNTKYFICRDEQRFEVFTCPNGGIFDDREKACIDLCEQKQPCLNQGQCIILSNLTLQCVCRRDWTGDRCEIPLSSCANNPCGPNAECRMLQASDYSQDYVCICDKQRSYGRNCQQTVPNPCLSNTQQFHPFAFSRRAYINCDDERIFFQPCNGKLYWDQEEKRCDRTLPMLLRAPFLNIRNRNPLMQWQRGADDNQQQQQNQGVNNPTPTNQGFVPLSQSWPEFQTVQNQRPLTNAFVETTTAAPTMFHLQGFSSRNSGQQNTQWQNNDQFQSQPWQDQNQQVTTTETVPQMSRPIQRNNRLGFIQDQQNQNDQFQTGQFETTTVANNDIQKGLSMNLLRGWQSNQQGIFNSVPTAESKSWKVLS